MTDAFWSGSATANLTLSNQPPIDVKSAVQGLLMYPYGCLEQTTSSAYPLVFIDEAGATAYGLSPRAARGAGQAAGCGLRSSGGHAAGFGRVWPVGCEQPL